MRTMNSLVSEIEQANKIVVCGHIMPDGDCISSVMSLSLGLEKLGKKAIPAIDWEIPPKFYEFPHIDKIVSYNEELLSSDLLIVVDASSPDRIGGFQSMMKSGVRTIVIDHHKTNTYFGNACWVDPKYSSTAQMIYHLLKLLDVNYDEELALLNYLGIATDTGFFRYSGVDASVFEDAAALVRLGAKPDVVARAILDNRRIEEFYLEREALAKLELCCDGKFAYSYLEKECFDKYGMTTNDFIGFVGELRSISTVEVAMFASEASKGEAHVSLRSKCYFDVSEVALAFGGGGHERAAGFTIRYDGELSKALKEVVEFIEERLRDGES